MIHLRPSFHLNPTLFSNLPHLPRYLPVINYCCVRRVESAQPRRVRLDLMQPFRTNLLYSDAVRKRTFVQRIQPRHLALVRHDNDLAATLVFNAVLITKLHHSPCALDTKSGLE